VDELSRERVKRRGGEVDTRRCRCCGKERQYALEENSEGREELRKKTAAQGDEDEGRGGVLLTKGWGLEGGGVEVLSMASFSENGPQF